MRVGIPFMSYLAMVVPTVLIAFGLVMAVIVGWRNWLGLDAEDKSRDDDKAN